MLCSLVFENWQVQGHQLLLTLITMRLSDLVRALSQSQARDDASAIPEQLWQAMPFGAAFHHRQQFS